MGFANLTRGVPVADVMQLIVDNVFSLKRFHDNDTCKCGLIQATYNKDATTGALTYYDAYPCNFLGVSSEGNDTRSALDDYPVYRYADCLLLLALAKAFMGDEPSEETNAVRERVYGETVFDVNKAELAYPNDDDQTLYTDNKSQNTDNASAIDAVLKE